MTSRGTDEQEAALAATSSAEREAALELLYTQVASGGRDADLAAFGNRMAAMLRVGLGSKDDDSVFGRSFAVLLLGACVERSVATGGLDETTVHSWCDAFCRWYVAETDTRGYVDGAGWAHAVAHGADALAAFASSAQLGTAHVERSADVVVERALAEDRPWCHGEADRLALAVDALPEGMRLIERLGEALVARRAVQDEDPYPAIWNADQLLRSLLLRSQVGSARDIRVRGILAQAYPHLRTVAE